MFFHDVPPFLLWLTVIIYGLALGSFTTCVVYRVPRGLPVMELKGKQSRSFCPSCGHMLQGRDLVPIFSWLSQKGRCRYCDKPIGSQYILIEAAVLLVVLVIAGSCGFSIKTLVLSVLIPVLAGLYAKWRPSSLS
jgi:leader peptidase (prepilin peptidase)/N-methyltransferase